MLAVSKTNEEVTTSLVKLVTSCREVDADQLCSDIADAVYILADLAELIMWMRGLIFDDSIDPRRIFANAETTLSKLENPPPQTLFCLFRTHV